MIISNRCAPRTSHREIEAALDEIGSPSHKAPKKIPVGISAPKPAPKKTRFYYGDRRVERQLRKPFGELDATIANGMKAQAALQIYAETAYDSSNPEDEIIDRLDRERGEQSLGKILCAIADRPTRRVVHHG